MDYKLLTKRLTRTVLAISSKGVLGREIGSGVSINIEGDLLTAGHVISERKHKSRIPKIAINVRREDGSSEDYEVRLPGIDLILPHFKKPILLDIGYIRRKKKYNDRQPFLELFGGVVEVGTEVLMAGYPEDVNLPFDFIKLLDHDAPPVKVKLDELLDSNRQLMLKSGIVGNANPFSFSVNGKSLEGQIFAIDNFMAKGSSGGPVVDSEGKIIGIIIEGSEIMSSILGEHDIELPIPSGITHAISARILISIDKALSS